MKSQSEKRMIRNFDMTSGTKDSIRHEQQNVVYQAPPSSDYAKLRVGMQVLEDAVLELSTYKKVNPSCANKVDILTAINNGDLVKMREISDFFYKTSGIYNRIVRYMAYMYRYDWFLTPYVNEENSSVNPTKVLTDFHKALKVLDTFGVKKKFGDIAVKVLKYGCYYGYKIQSTQGTILQELDPNYCRSKLYYGSKPAVEFNMKFFDDYFRDTTQRIKMLKLFPPEFSKGYSLYKQGKLKPEVSGDGNGWYLLDPEFTVKFSSTDEDYPMFISVIPLILDLEEAQALDRKKTMQRLLKIVVQKMPMDKNGELIFDPEEARQLHNNAVQMLGRAINVDVLTTFADVEVESLADSNAVSAQADDLLRVERQLYNEAGVSQMQFNTDGNIALEKSILNDAATMYNLLLQFEEFLNELMEPFNKNPKKVEYRVQLLTTTIYNYQELAKLYKEQTQLGYSKMLPQIALGQSQSSILANAYFENEILDLMNVFIPPLMSSTMNGDTVAKLRGTDAEGGSSSGSGTSTPGTGTGEGAGRKEKADDQKSEKTLKNRESMN